jgi:hypothetical protein
MLQNFQERAYLEKRISSIEMNTLNSDQNESESIEDIDRSKNSQEPPFLLANQMSMEDESSLLYKSTSMLETQENDKMMISNSSNISLGQFR